MKKHRSLLLMGTLIAPILLTTGDALATSGINKTPTSTSVMIHAITDVSDTDPADAPTLWGSGEEKDLKTLQAADPDTTWETTTGATFTAYELPDGVVTYTNSGSEPKIATEKIKGIDWSKLLTVIDVPAGAATTNDAKTQDISDKTIEVVDRDKFVAAVKDAGLKTQTSGPTDGAGETKMTLPNGQWVITQDSDATGTDEALPIFLDLPMGKVNGSDTDYWYDTESPLHVYTKQYKTASLTIKKTDAETKKALGGAQILLAPASSQDKLNEVLPQLIKDIEKTPAKADALVAAALGLTSDQFTIESTDKDGQVVFDANDGIAISKGQQYVIAELMAPKGYLTDPQVTVVTAEQDSENAAKLVNYDELQVDKAITVDNQTFGANEKGTGDDKEGIARGQKFTWDITSELNKNIADYTNYTLTDEMPYQVNWMSMDLALTYTQNGETKSVPLSQVVNGLYPINESTDKSLIDEGVTGKGLGFTTDQNGSTLNGKTIAYDAATAPKVTSLAEGFDASSFNLFGHESTYTFVGQGDSATPARVVDWTKPVENGEIVLDMTASGRQAMGALIEKLLAEGADDGSWNLSWKINSAGNTALQADHLVNKIDLDYNTKYDGGSDDDKTHTFTAGWEIIKTDGDVKTDSNGNITNGLAGAGFDLGLKVTSTNIDEVIAEMYTAARFPNMKRTASEQDVQQLRDDVKAGKTRWVYFMHEDMTTGEPMASMHSNASDPMGDILWTIREDNATTHYSGPDGYLQYCGLAGGDYQLIEREAPSGYKLMTEPHYFTLSNTQSGKINGAATSDDITVANYRDEKPQINDTPTHAGGILPYTATALGGLLTLLGLAGLIALIKKRRAQNND
ncbi:SpaA isopeptide-forming pilin-related protein [Weissella confusa]|uniref:SpaA isopeptide-forming pilin-related protein n=1 Tax=Weissella confusa TaxID=1583 RepID=UPI0022E1F9A6|nr:SpaA isopeptide-forming pilin-related protein [Weissella confusa]MEE0001991.1 SpaA isopeptide-forming pilin-related protein [Weissella confusa]